MANKITSSRGGMLNRSKKLIDDEKGTLLRERFMVHGQATDNATQGDTRADRQYGWRVAGIIRPFLSHIWFGDLQ